MNVRVICPVCGLEVLAAVDDALVRLSHRQVAHTACPGCAGYIDILLPQVARTRREPASHGPVEELPPERACTRCGGPADLVEPRRGAPYVICRRRCGSNPNTTTRSEE